MEEIGQSPITLRREALGFALNRIQYACINECWNMYKVIPYFFAYKIDFFTFQNNPKNLDPSNKIDLDLGIVLEG